MSLKGSFSLDAFDPELNQQQASQILSAVDHRWSAFKNWGQSVSRGREVWAKGKRTTPDVRDRRDDCRDGVTLCSKHERRIKVTLDPALVPEGCCRRYCKE